MKPKVHETTAGRIRIVPTAPKPTHAATNPHQQTPSFAGYSYRTLGIHIANSARRGKRATHGQQDRSHGVGDKRLLQGFSNGTDQLIREFQLILAFSAQQDMLFNLVDFRLLKPVQSIQFQPVGVYVCHGMRQHFSRECPYRHPAQPEKMIPET